MAPIKPSKQTQILLDQMSRSADEEKPKWDQVMENFDLLFTQIQNMGITQTEMKNQIAANNAKVDQVEKNQAFMTKQIQANGQVVAQFTINQLRSEDDSSSSRSSSLMYDEEQSGFHNVFTSDKDRYKVGPSKGNRHRHTRTYAADDDMPRHILPKMLFPKFDGTHPKIWRDNCLSYFAIYSVPEKLWVTAATMHLEGNAAMWWQAYKQAHQKVSWKALCQAVEQQFGTDDYRTALTELIALKHSGTVEEYTSQFQQLQYQVIMHGGPKDDLFFTSHYVSGLKDEIRGMVEPQTPPTVARAAIVARIQEKLVDRSKVKGHKPIPGTRPPPAGKNDAKVPQTPGTLWRDRQLRDYKRANGLCYSCGEKYEPGHNEVCAKKVKPQTNAMIVNDLDRELQDEVLDQLAVEDELHDQQCQLSINAMSSVAQSDCIKLKAKI